MFCTKCGFNLSGDVKFCPNCGTEVENNNAAQQNQEFYQKDIIDEDVKLLIGKNQEYYVPKFSKMKQLNKKMTWNWPAFLVGPMWFMYRKMYHYGLGLLLFNIVFEEIMPLGISLAISAVIAAFANYLYMQQLEGHALYMKSAADTARWNIAEEKGGTSAKAVWLIIGVSFVISLIKNMIF